MMSSFEKWAELPHHHVLKLRRGNGYHGMHYLHALCLEDLSEIPQQSLDLPFLNREQPFAANSCGGLLFFNQCLGKFSLCNPTTKQFRSFNEKRCYSGALGFDSKSQDYKIVRIGKREESREIYTELYSFRSSDSDDKEDWREIPKAPPIILSPLDQHVYVAAAGKAYWLSSEAIQSFDFTSETFSSFPFPPLPYFCCEIARVLVKLHDGLLGVVCYWRRGSCVSFDEENLGYYYELWAWTEEERDWYRMCDAVCLCGGVGQPLGLIDGRLLILRGASNPWEGEYAMLVYDWTTKECIDPHPRLYSYDRCTTPVTPVLSYVETSDELPLPLPMPQGEPIQPLPQDREDGVNENCRGEDYKIHGYEEFKDWATNGFRVVDKYHPSEERFVFDSESDELKIDGDSQREQLIEDDRKRKRALMDEKENQTSVFVYGIPVKANKNDVAEFFSQAGKVRDVELITDQKSKQVWHIEFDDAACVAMARALSGRLFLGKPLVVVKNLVESKAVVSVTETFSTTIRLENLPPSISENHLFELLERFGIITRVLIPPELPDSAYVRFRHLSAAKEAQCFDGQLEMAGRIIKVSSVCDIPDDDDDDDDDDNDDDDDGV